MKCDRNKRIFLFFIIVFFGFCALFAAQKIVSYDDWWHLKTGEWIWHNMKIPHVDPFSYTFHDAEWIDYEWLFQVVIYPIHWLSGFSGLIVFKIVIVLLTFVILFLTCREIDGGKIWLSITILFMALLVAKGRFVVRPQIFSLLFLALYMYLLTLHRGDKITTRTLFLALIPAHVLWVNFHGGFLTGIFLVGAHALGRFIPLALRHHRDLTPVCKDKKLQGLVLLCLLLCMLSLLNPYTYHAFLFPLRTAGSETLRGIAEWLSIDIRYLGLVTIDYTMWFRVLFLIGAISFLIWRDNLKKIEDVAIFVFFSYMAFKHIRFGGDFAVVAAPIIINNIKKLRWKPRGWTWIRLLPFFVMLVFCVNEVKGMVELDRLGFGVWRNYPETNVNFLKEHGVKGKIFNSYGYGGYIIWHLWPDIPVFIDGRTPTIYDQDFFWLNGLAYDKKEIWEKVCKRYGIEIVLVRDDRERGYLSLFSWLDNDEQWRLVAFDDVSNLYIKKETQFDELIEKYGFRYLRPADVSLDYVKEKKADKQYLKEVEKELQAACQRFPRDFYPFYYLGVYHQIYGTEDHFQEAEKFLRKAIANRPDFPRGHAELGFTLMKLERYDEAAQTLTHATRISRSLPVDVYYYLGVSLFNNGKIEKAIEFLEKYKERAGFETRTDAYELLGKAYMKKYKLHKALSCFERLTYLEESTWEIYVNMGVAYFGLDNLEKAQEFFEKAMEMKPDNLKVIYNLAVVYEGLGFTERAKRLFHDVSQMSPQTPEEEQWVQQAKEMLQ